MHAAYIERLGSPDEIHFGELPDPRPGAADVLVAVLATTVNPVDTFVRSGLFRTPIVFPFVIGRDLAGRVLEAGPDTSGFTAGDLVWSNSLGHGGRQGAAAGLAVVPADRLYHLPPGVDLADAVAVVHPAATAHLALFTHGDLCAGETVLVAGGGGNVGGALIEMAVGAGARVIATAAPRDFDRCRSIGADQVFDYHDPELAGHLRGAAPAGVDLHLDTSGTNDLEQATGLLAPRGRIVLLAGARSRPILPAGELYMKDGAIRGFVISRAQPAELADAATSINRLLGAGLLRPRAVDVEPLSAAAGVHRRLEEGALRGRRTVLQP